MDISSFSPDKISTHYYFLGGGSACLIVAIALGALGGSSDLVHSLLDPQRFSALIGSGVFSITSIGLLATGSVYWKKDAKDEEFSKKFKDYISSSYGTAPIEEGFDKEFEKLSSADILNILEKSPDKICHFWQLSDKTQVRHIWEPIFNDPRSAPAIIPFVTFVKNYEAEPDMRIKALGAMLTREMTNLDGIAAYVTLLEEEEKKLFISEIVQDVLLPKGNGEVKNAKTKIAILSELKKKGLLYSYLNKEGLPSILQHRPTLLNIACYSENAEVVKWILENYPHSAWKYSISFSQKDGSKGEIFFGICHRKLDPPDLDLGGRFKNDYTSLELCRHLKFADDHPVVQVLLNYQ